MGNCCSGEPRREESKYKGVYISYTNSSNNVNTINGQEVKKRKSKQIKEEGELLVKTKMRPKISKKNKDTENSDDDSSDNHYQKRQINSKSGLKLLELKDVKFYKDKIEMSSSVFIKTRSLYNYLGQYDYNGETYIDDIEDSVGKIDWSKYYYVGQFKNNSKVPDGIGITVWNSGDIYEGYHRNGVMNGNGRYIYSKGDYYIGEWIEGKRNGKGEHYSEDGEVYQGEWKDDKRHGKGTQTHSDGTKETGNWKNDKFLRETAF